MSDCKYCGKPAGILKSFHKDCERMHLAGIERMLTITTDSVFGILPKQGLMKELEEIAETSFIHPSMCRSILVNGWERAVELFLEDSIIDETEEKHLTSFANYFDLTKEELDTNGAFYRVVLGAVLRDVLQGIFPKRQEFPSNLPFRFQKNEQLAWLFYGVDLFEKRTRNEYVGGHQGISVRIARGVYYRTGIFKGRSIEVEETRFLGSGLLGITNRHLYFCGGKKSFRIKHEKIVSIEPFSDGVCVQKDTQSAKPLIFKNCEGWFLYNLLMNISNL